MQAYFLAWGQRFPALEVGFVAFEQRQAGCKPVTSLYASAKLTIYYLLAVALYFPHKQENCRDFLGHLGKLQMCVKIISILLL